MAPGTAPPRRHGTAELAARASHFRLSFCERPWVRRGWGRGLESRVLSLQAEQKGKKGGGKRFVLRPSRFAFEVFEPSGKLFKCAGSYVL